MSTDVGRAADALFGDGKISIISVAIDPFNRAFALDEGGKAVKDAVHDDDMQKIFELAEVKFGFRSSREEKDGNLCITLRHDPVLAKTVSNAITFLKNNREELAFSQADKDGIWQPVNYAAIMLCEILRDYRIAMDSVGKLAHSEGYMMMMSTSKRGLFAHKKGNSVTLKPAPVPA